MRYSVFERKVILLMSYGEVKTYGVGKGFDPFGDDLVNGMAILFAGIVGLDFETAHDQTGQPVELTRALQMPEHPVDAIEVFTGIFHEEDLALGIDIGA